MAARRGVVYTGKGALLSAALMTATLVAPARDTARAQGTTVTGTAADLLLRTGSRGPAVAAVGDPTTEIRIPTAHISSHR